MHQLPSSFRYMIIIFGQFEFIYIELTKRPDLSGCMLCYSVCFYTLFCLKMINNMTDDVRSIPESKPKHMVISMHINVAIFLAKNLCISVNNSKLTGKMNFHSANKLHFSLSPPQSFFASNFNNTIQELNELMLKIIANHIKWYELFHFKFIFVSNFSLISHFWIAHGASYTKYSLVIFKFFFDGKYYVSFVFVFE